MSNQRPPLLTAVIILNVLLGTIALMSAVFLLTFRGMADFGDYVELKAALCVAGTVLGIGSGVWLLKDKKGAAALAIAFSVTLLLFQGLLLYERSFRFVDGTVAIVYAIASGGYLVVRTSGSAGSRPMKDKREQRRK